MDFINHITIKDILLLLLIVILFRLAAYIMQLKEELKAAKKKQITPFLDIEINSDESGLFLVNNSNCYAKNIGIADADFIANVGFKKQLRLVFESVESLQVSERKKLNFKVFDNNADITGSRSKNLINYFKDSETKIKLRYSNIENKEFISTLEIKDDKFQIKDVRSFEEVLEEQKQA